MHSDISIFISVPGWSSSLDWVWASKDYSLVFLYDTMCYDYEHGASDTCTATDVVLARQISECRDPVYDVLSNRCQEYECLTQARSQSIAAPLITQIALHNSRAMIWILLIPFCLILLWNGAVNRKIEGLFEHIMAPAS